MSIDKYYPHADICEAVHSAFDPFDLSHDEKVATLKAVIDCLEQEEEGRHEYLERRNRLKVIEGEK